MYRGIGQGMGKAAYVRRVQPWGMGRKGGGFVVHDTIEERLEGNLQKSCFL